MNYLYKLIEMYQVQEEDIQIILPILILYLLIVQELLVEIQEGDKIEHIIMQIMKLKV